MMKVWDGSLKLSPLRRYFLECWVWGFFPSWAQNEFCYKYFQSYHI